MSEKVSKDLKKAHQKYLQELKKQLEKEIADQTVDTKNLNRSGLDMEDLRKELAQKEEVASCIGMQAEILSLERDAPPRVKLLEEATVRKLR
jgi:hypothetical protein